MPKKQIIYKDLWVKIVGSLLASQLIDLLNREESFFQRITSFYFYTDLLGGFAIALILWEFVRQGILWLDKKYDWLEKPVTRIIAQALLCVLFPAFLSFVLTFLFMKLAYHQDIFKTTWPYNEFYAIILIILLVNLIYFTWWLYLKWRETKTVQSTIASSESLPTIASINQNITTSTIQVSKAGKTILLPLKDISYAYLSNGYCYIRAFAGDGYMTNYSMDEVARILGEIYFFRVNRQMVVNRDACTAYRSVENGKIEIDLNPTYREPVIVSQKRAKDFRRWIAPVELNR